MLLYYRNHNLSLFNNAYVTYILLKQINKIFIWSYTHLLLFPHKLKNRQTLCIRWVQSNIHLLSFTEWAILAITLIAIFHNIFAKLHFMVTSKMSLIGHVVNDRISVLLFISLFSPNLFCLCPTLQFVAYFLTSGMCPV